MQLLIAINTNNLKNKKIEAYPILIIVASLEFFSLTNLNLMNKFFTLLVFALFAFTANAQLDTLVYQNFNEPFDSLQDESDGVAPFALGNDVTWVNFDEDGIPDASADRGNSWYQDLTGWFDEDSAQLGVMLSSSWLQGFANGNRNWLILPPVGLSAVGNANATLSWKSAPFQGPRYLDGYSVRISTSSNDPLATPYPFTDTVFQAAQMETLGTDWDVSTFGFSPGYIHANGYTDLTYCVLDTPLNTTYNGFLEPHTIDLSPYAGMTIYIAFVHDSDDDNFLALDDIMVMGKAFGVNTNNVALEAEVTIFPNPVTTSLNLNYNVEAAGDVTAMVFNAQGQLVREFAGLSSASGEYNHTLEVSDLATGNYQLVLTQNGKRITKRFIKQ